MTVTDTAPAVTTPKVPRPVPIQHTLMPRVHAPLGTLAIAMSIMCFLASLAIGGLVLVNRAVDKWTSDISGQLTVQVRPTADDDLAQRTQQAADILEKTPGITGVTVLSEDAAARLLEPWLGKSRILEELPIPRLIAATVDKRNPPDVKALAAALDAKVHGSSLDTHRQWQDELTATAHTLRWLGLAVLLIIIFASIGLVIYASRSALETNREVLEVLYLVGAGDRFIARQVERRFFATGFKAGLAGVIGGLLTFAIFYAIGYTGRAPTLYATVGDLLAGPIDRTWLSYLWFAVIPIVATLICVVTARIATMRILRSIF